MIHVHFGAGRLGLGLVLPFFQAPGIESFLLNRAVSGARPTGSTTLAPDRRNELLAAGPDHAYVIQACGTDVARREVVRFDGFRSYADGEAGDVVRPIVKGSAGRMDGVIVTASLLSAANYPPVLQALEALSGMRARGEVGPVFLAACENTLTAHDVFEDPDLRGWLPEETMEHVTCVHALVDRVCVGMEEGSEAGRPVVVVQAEEYGSLKLELTPGTEALAARLRASRVEFTRHVAVEKQIKSWLLNGSHWLLALAAFQESRGDRELRLNEFLSASPERRHFAQSVMNEMHEGVAVILRREPRYADFVRDCDPDVYLRGAVDAVLPRFMSNDDPMSRILARFQAPTPEAPRSIEAFSRRFSDRVDEPLSAFADKRGFAPPAAIRSVQSLVRLIASGTYIDAA